MTESSSFILKSSLSKYWESITYLQKALLQTNSTEINSDTKSQWDSERYQAFCFLPPKESFQVNFLESLKQGHLQTQGHCKRLLAPG